MFNGIGLIETTGAGTTVTGVIPNSEPNMAAFGPLDTTTLEQGTPSMTTVYSDSTITYFDLQSFYYGCVVTSAETVEGVPESCTITVTGYNTNGQEVASQTFAFNSNGGVQQQMQQAVLSSSFKHLQHADFSVNTATGNATTSGLIDTVAYTVYSTQPLGAN